MDLLDKKIGFSFIKHLGYSRAEEILDKVGGVDRFFELPTRDLWEIIGSQQGFCTDKSRSALLKAGATELRFIHEKKISAAFLTDDEYPDRLRNCEDAPLMLYKLGECDLNHKYIISIVGTRRATAYGQRFTSDLVSGLAEMLDKPVIVSGLAYGIDVAAHKAALDAGVPTVAVVAHGLTTIYPADHRNIAAKIIKAGGAVVTEYNSSAPVHRGNFLARNRIVAGMADATVIVESDEKGGAMVTASIASSYNRDVFAPPGRVTDRYSRGPLKLIRSRRAEIIRDAADLIESMNWEAIKPKNVSKEINYSLFEENLGDEKRKIVDFLRKNAKASVDEMVHALDIPYSLLSARLMEMEMDDMVSVLPGSVFVLNI